MQTTVLPLTGVKVLDFSWVVVGGLLTKQLADYGAEVIKIESINRLCGTRVEAHTARSRRGDPDDKPWFAHLNTSKKSIQLDLKSPAANEIIEGLVEWADLVVENFSPGTMEKMGLSYERLKAINPGIVMVSGSVFGQTGPLSREWGIDSTGAALSGRIAMTGWPDRAPVVPSVVYGDGLLPMILAAAAIAAIDNKDRTGLGCHVDGSMLDVLVQQIAPAALFNQLAEAQLQRSGNRTPNAVPHGVFPCKGDDKWIAIAITTETEWRAFTLALGHPEWADDGRFSDFESRKTHEGELEQLIAETTKAFSAHDLMHRLAAAEVPAGAVQDASDLLERDPQLKARGFLVRVDHPALGEFDQQATPYKLSATPALPGPAPCLGQHTEYVCKSVLKMPAERFAELSAQGLFK